MSTGLPTAASVVATIVYICLLAVWVRSGSRTTASHVLPVDPVGSGRPSLKPTAGRIVAASILAAGLFIAETIAVQTYGPVLVAEMQCATGSLLPRCSLPDSEIENPRLVAFIGFLACSIAGLILHRVARKQLIFPFLALVLSVVAFGAAADAAIGGNASASSSIIFGAFITTEIIASSALVMAFAVARVSVWRCAAKPLLIYAAVAVLRLSGLVAFTMLWQALPPAMAVAALLTGFLLPVIGASSMIVVAAVVPDGPRLAPPA